MGIIDNYMMQLILVLVLALASSLLGQVTSTPVGTRTQLVSQVGTLVCRLDNIGGATTTIHIYCTVPLGYIKIETTTPRLAEKGGSGGWFTDDNGNTVMWILQQKIRGVVSYQVTDSTGGMSQGVF